MALAVWRTCESWTRTKDQEPLGSKMQNLYAIQVLSKPNISKANQIRLRVRVLYEHDEHDGQSSARRSFVVASCERIVYIEDQLGSLNLVASPVSTLWPKKGVHFSASHHGHPRIAGCPQERDIPDPHQPIPRPHGWGRCLLLVSLKHALCPKTWVWTIMPDSSIYASSVCPHSSIMCWTCHIPVHIPTTFSVQQFNDKTAK